MQNAPPAIDEIVGFLDTFDPESLQALRRKFPSQSEILKPGIIGGKREEVLQVRLAVALKGLGEIERASGNGVRILKNRLSRANVLELIGDTVALLGSSTAVVTAMNTMNNKFGAVIGASALALTGSLAKLVATFLRRTVQGGRDGLVKHYQTLLKAAPQARQLLAEFEAVLQSAESRPSMKEISPLIRAANLLSRDVYEALGAVPQLRQIA
jgi:hypothetical protein